MGNLMHVSERQQLVEAVHDRGAHERGSSRGRLLVVRINNDGKQKEKAVVVVGCMREGQQQREAVGDGKLDVREWQAAAGRSGT